MKERVSEQELDDALTNVLDSLGSPSTDLACGCKTGKKAQADAYFEMYIYALVAEVLKDNGANPIVRDKDRLNRFLVRRSHGDISDNNPAYSYVEFQLNGTRYELHVDAFYKVRRGGGKLEVDISITKESVANRVRSGVSERPSNRSLFLLLEAKHYSGNASTNVATGYIGRCTKLRVKSRPEGLVMSNSMSFPSKMHVTSENLHVFDRVTPLKVDEANVLDFKSTLSKWLQRSL